MKTRIREFEENSKKSSEELFKELCFCILTANFHAERSLKIWEELGNDFINLPESRLTKKLRILGHRYPRTRAKYIVEARRYVDFLRNIRFTNFAIIDFHILNILARYGLIKRPKTLTRRKYLEIENFLRNVAEKLNISLAELDLYLWYIETGKVLK